MSDLDYCVVSLRLSGDDLDPAAVTARLGVEPTRAWRTGDWSETHKRPRPKGGWILEGPAGEPRDLDAKIKALLAALPHNPDLWRELAAFKPDMFCGLFMLDSNAETALTPATLAMLAERGLTLGLDIYGPADE